MARHELLETILAARFELEYAEPKELPERIATFNLLLDQATANTHLTRREILWELRVTATRNTNARNCWWLRGAPSERESDAPAEP